MELYDFDSSCCCEPVRGFMTKDEKIEMLNKYKELLEKETKGVSEEIDRLKKK
jgi:hypothetical protein